MSLASICQSVLSETGWPVYGSIATNSDATAQQIFAIANTELEALSELFSWPQLQEEYEFNATLAQTVYLWPPDFRVLLPSSVFNASEYYELKGSTGLQFWELLKYGKLGNLSRARFRNTYPLGAPAIEITPPINAALVAVYDSKHYVRTSQGDTLVKFMNDTDVAKIPERYITMGVKWRFRRAKGMDFSAELAEYNATIKTQFAKYTGAAEIPIGGHRINELAGLTSGYVRDQGFGV